MGGTGASFGIEGGDNAGTVGYGTSVVGTSATAFQTSDSAIEGLPSIPSNPLESTVNSGLPYIGAVNENP